MTAPVSVIIPCYCCAETVARAVNSVMRQTLMPRELLLVDDGSNDSGQTISALYRLQEQYEEQLKIYVIELEENQGSAFARNEGWNSASQPFLAFLDADDAWHPRKLEIQYHWMHAHPQVTLTGHLSVWLRPEMPAPELPNQWRERQITARQMFLSNRFFTRCVMLRRDIPYRFDPKKRGYSEDYLLWLSVILSGYPAWRLELPLAYSFKAEFGASGYTSHLWKMEKGELNTYWQLYDRGLISPYTVIALTFLSFTKYLRRLLLSPIKKRQ